MLTVLFLVGGCQTYLDNAEARTPGEFTDDLAIQTLVKTRMMRDPDVRGLRINVDVKNGVVWLRGPARSDAERQRALVIAAGVPNVERVVDELVVDL